MKRIIITGATGLIGNAIAAKLIKRGDEVVVFSRSPKKAERKLPGAFKYVEWHYDTIGKWSDEMEKADYVIHLAGENVMGARWTEDHKKKIMESRVIGTENLVKAIENSSSKPKAFICASAIGYYDSSIENEVDENSPAGSDFLSEVTQKWEDAASEVEKLGVRRVSIRIGIVLDKTEGALAKMLTPFKYFVGGPIGSGKQWMPWIHIDDLSNLFIYTIDNDIKGVLNGVSPNPIRMKEFASTLGKVLSRPSIFSVPSFVLRIILGEGAEAVLRGSKVQPVKTVEAGFNFKHPYLDEALKQILK